MMPLRSTSLEVAIATLFICAPIGMPVAGAQSLNAEQEGIYVQEKYTHDDNLFRLPAAQQVNRPSGARTLQDDINRLSLGVHEKIEHSRQKLLLDIRADDVRFSRNDHLDHVAGEGAVQWDWELFDAWSGKLEADYTRALTDFSSTRVVTRDLVERSSYEGELRYRLGPRWSVLGGARSSRIEHSAVIGSFNDFASESARGTLIYETPSAHSVELEYRFSAGEFDNLPDITAGLHSREYEENTALVRFGYTATVRTRFDLTYGYIRREYLRSDDQAGEFSGAIWRAAVTWTPRVQFQMQLAGWRELRAHVDAESDYFVSEGVSIGPVWLPYRSLALSLSVARAKQPYIGSNPLLTDSLRRSDDVTSGVARITYDPIRRLRLELTYRAEERNSNLDWLDYDAAIGSASARLTF